MRLFFRELHGHRADCTRRSRDQDALTAGKFAVIKNSLPRRQRCDWHRRGRIEVNVFWLTHEFARGAATYSA